MTNDDLMERLLDWPYQGETMAHEAACRIKALTAERDYTEGTNDTLIALNQSLTADNARLLKALTNAGSHLERGLDKMAFNIIRRALNTGKEPSNE
jgi:hypothetical protein